MCVCMIGNKLVSTFTSGYIPIKISTKAAIFQDLSYGISIPDNVSSTSGFLAPLNIKDYSKLHKCRLCILAANILESLLLNGTCVNLIGIYCFWSYVQLRNEILLISLIHYVTKLNGHTQYLLGTPETQEKEKSELGGTHLKWSLPSHYHFDTFMQRGVSVNTIDISLNF